MPRTILRDLLVSDFECDARIVGEWEGWQCHRTTVEISIEGDVDGVQSIVMACPDLSEAGADRIEEVMTMLLGTIVVFQHVAEDTSVAPINLFVGAKEVAGDVFVMLLEAAGTYAAMQQQDEVNVTAIFKGMGATVDEAAGDAAALMASVPVIERT